MSVRSTAKRSRQAWKIKDCTKGRRPMIRLFPPHATVGDIEQYCTAINGNIQGTILKAVPSGRSMIVTGRHNCSATDLQNDVKHVLRIKRVRFPAHRRAKGHKSKHANITRRRAVNNKKRVATRPFAARTA